MAELKYLRDNKEQYIIGGIKTLFYFSIASMTGIPYIVFGRS